MSTVLRIAYCILLWLYLGVSAAAVENLYQVEVLIFEQPASESIDIEDWSVAVPDLALENSVRLRPSSEKTEAFHLLDESLLNLKPVALALQQKMKATVLLHQAWLQPIGSPCKIHLFDDSWGMPKVEGAVSLRKLHHIELNVDLRYKFTRTGINANLVMQEKRRLRLDELHYFDHPAFGMLVKIIKVV